ncbi:glycosyltransferase family 4 protein [Sphingomonas sp.]|uniref:glycosyltransferase family 4 protein n=1 Tax=Sphingomonas sp. TaxID=28214 RepID=UPI003B3B7346
MRRPRVLMTADTIGGVWTYALELARALVPLGYDPILAVLGPAPSAAQQAEADAASGVRLIETGLPLDWLAPDAAAVRASAAALAVLATDIKADIVHLNQPAFAGAADFPAPVVAALHSCVETWWHAAGDGPPPASFAWQTDLVRAGLHAADRVLCPSAAFAAEAQAAYDLPVTPSVVHNGRTARAYADAAPHDFAITAGRLWDKGKNVATLDRAAGQLSVPFKAFGPLEAPHGEQVRFEHLYTPGNVDEATLAACLAPRPVFASAALYEPFGLAVLEAASAGCALVLSDIPTFRELWSDAAIFVPAMDADGFARVIGAVVGDSALRAELGSKARAAAQAYTPDRMAAATAALYRNVVPAAAAKAAA